MHTPVRMEDFAVTCPLVPGGPTPRIRILCVAPRGWIGLPPDPTVRLSSRRSLAVTPLPFSSPSAPRSPGARTLTSLVLRHAWHTRPRHQRQREALSVWMPLFDMPPIKPTEGSRYPRADARGTCRRSICSG